MARSVALTAVCALLLCSAAFAQVAVKGKWTPGKIQSKKAFELPIQNNEELLAQEDKSHGGYQFAHPVSVFLGLKEGAWTDVDGGRVWQLTISSPKAYSLGLTFDRYYLPPGAELYIYNNEQVRGAFTSLNNKKHGWMSVWPLTGDSITLELFVPSNTTNHILLSVFKVSHGYKALGFGDSGRCNINTICPDGDAWRNQIRGVAMMLTAFGSRYCSGSMINNINNDGRQLFLTADHCTSGNMYSDQLMFLYESSVCDLSSQRDGPTTNTVSGLIDLGSFSASDYHVFEVEEPIPASYNVYLNGFSAENIPATSVVGIHHPSGDVKKISFARKAVTPTFWNELPNQYHWRVSSWDDGTTEPGSSGSPLFDQNQRIVGQLHGGAASCTNIDYDSYGAIWASWDSPTIASDKLSVHLDPSNTGRRVIDGIDLNFARANAKKN